MFWRHRSPFSVARAQFREVSFTRNFFKTFSSDELHCKQQTMWSIISHSLSRWQSEISSRAHASVLWPSVEIASICRGSPKSRYLSCRRLAWFRAGATSLQALWRRYVLCKRFRLISLASIQFQARFRGRRVRTLYRIMRFDHQIIHFMALSQRVPCRKRYAKRMSTSKTLQHFWRFHLVRKAFEKRMKKEKK